MPSVGESGTRTSLLGFDRRFDMVVLCGGGGEGGEKQDKQRLFYNCSPKLSTKKTLCESLSLSLFPSPIQFFPIKLPTQISHNALKKSTQTP